MEDIIRLLPEAVANQIAAGEVVQRPASAVKELLENAVDAGGKNIQLVVKDAGRTLIQVIDDGKGMSFNDARLCFERHATSKIRSAEDLFSIHTKGFRGEALASIAAIAHVELKTKRAEDETGTVVLIEGGEVKEQSPTTTANGTSISVRNLFFNVPARRNFLKSDNTEFGCIEEEFIRVALIHPDIAFTLYHNGKLTYQLKEGNFKQRISGIFGSHFNDRIFPIEQETNYIKITGFLGKPESAKKKRAEQYMFINHRFIKNSSLHFAIESAYEQVLPDGTHPLYFLSIELDPATVDVNVSPTKVDIKLQDDRVVYGFLFAAVKKAIGEFSLIPQLDFDYDTDLDLNNVPQTGPIKVPHVSLSPGYNPFNSFSNPRSTYQQPSHHSTSANPDWDSFLKGIKETEVTVAQPEEQKVMQFEDSAQDMLVEVTSYIVVQKRYLFVSLQDKMHVIDIVRANERIIYENYLQALKDQPVTVQQSLFPETVVLNGARAELLTEIRGDLLKLGYDIEPMGGGNFAVNGTPHDEEEGDVQTMVENLLDEYQSHLIAHRAERDKNLALSLAHQKKAVMKPLSNLQEVNHFLQQLFACLLPSITPSGKKIFEVMEVEKMF
ncbi:MAG: DNA mismatch repair endonuclease MutL [Bacteroidales bacterium]|nr:DNA mismatch repair endonuclease MutL [Bacteroidales bacterium]